MYKAAFSYITHQTGQLQKDAARASVTEWLYDITVPAAFKISVTS